VLRRDLGIRRQRQSQRRPPKKQAPLRVQGQRRLGGSTSL